MTQLVNNLKSSLCIAALLALPLGSAMAMDKAQYKAEKERISAAEKADKKACDSLSGNAKDVCIQEAKAKDKIAKAELEATHSGKPRDQEKLAKARAEAAYDVAKEKCDDKTGNEKDVCVKEAKAAKDKAEADIKASKKSTSARADAVDDKRDAEYKVAAEKCDTLGGDAKDACKADAKAKFGKS
jgi:hypothetical protein